MRSRSRQWRSRLQIEEHTTATLAIYGEIIKEYQQKNAQAEREEDEESEAGAEKERLWLLDSGEMIEDQ